MSYRDEDQAAHVADSHDLRSSRRDEHVLTQWNGHAVTPYISLRITEQGQLDITYGEGITPTEAAAAFFAYALREQVDGYIRRRLQAESEARGE